MKIAFWFSLLFLLYAYAGYPLLMAAAARRGARARPRTTAFPQPAVTLLVSAYNEEASLDEKLRNTLALEYPRALLEIVVISDGSTDRTDETVLSFAHHGIRLRRFEGRIGKTACLNSVVPDCRGEIIVFSDANSLYHPKALAFLVAPFADPAIGFTTGYTRYRDADSSETPSSSLGLYASLEKTAKKGESVLASCVGADGAIFAVRKRLYQPLLNTDINDFVLPLRIIRQGYRGVLADDAFCVEQSAGSAAAEFRRQVRITNRTLRALRKERELFNPAVYGLFSFALFSHKVAKLAAPFFLATLAVSAFVLAGEAAVYRFASIALAAGAVLAAADVFAGKVPLLGKVTPLFSTFFAANIAILGGWVQFIKGETYTTWSPVKR